MTRNGRQVAIHDPARQAETTYLLRHIYVQTDGVEQFLVIDYLLIILRLIVRDTDGILCFSPFIAVIFPDIFPVASECFLNRSSTCSVRK